MTNTRRVDLFVLATIALAIVASYGVLDISQLGDQRDAAAAGFFFCFGLLAQVLRYQRGQQQSATIGFLPYLSISALAPNGAALACILSSVLVGEILVRREFVKGLFNVAQHVLAAALGLLVYLGLGGSALLEQPTRVAAFLTAFVAMFVTFMVTNRVVVSGVLSIVNHTAFFREFYISIRRTLLNDVLALPLVLIFAFAYSKLGPFWCGALALPMIGIRQLYKSVFELERINEELLQLMVAAIEARDPYTSGHSQRVARYSRVIARAIGLGSRQVEEVGTAALLHDVGKIHEEFAPLLRQPRKLSEAEFEVMKTHSAKGAVLVAKVSQFKAIVPAVRGHHESWNGKGYPDGLAGDAIPLGARIVTLADTIDAMTTVRPYRPPRSIDEVFTELERVAGVQFDPRICATLLSAERWRELSLEVEIATREFPAVNSGLDPVSAEIPRSSMESRVS